jgi:chemotaxis protein MotB
MKKVFAISCLMVLISCVSTKKYNDLLTKKVRLEGDYAECQDSLNQNQLKNKKNRDKIGSLESLIKKIKYDSAAIADNLARTQKMLAEQNATSDRLRKDYKDLLAGSSAESNKLASNLASKEQRLLDLEKSLQQTKADNDKLLTDLKEREKRVKELVVILNKKDSAVASLKNIVADALLSFKDKDLTVVSKNGKVYVSLSEQLLFKSGSTTVDPKGAEALKKLASVLKTQQEVNVMVEGHTDDVPIAKGSNTPFTDNWDLSVLRATDIVRILLREGVNPKKLTAAGRSQFVPLDEAKTIEARQKNRRTEIILTPKMDELFKILGSE